MKKLTARDLVRINGLSTAQLASVIGGTDGKKSFELTISYTVETLKYSPESSRTQG